MKVIKGFCFYKNLFYYALLQFVENNLQIVDCNLQHVMISFLRKGDYHDAKKKSRSPKGNQ